MCLFNLFVRHNIDRFVRPFHQFKRLLLGFDFALFRFSAAAGSFFR